MVQSKIIIKKIDTQFDILLTTRNCFKLYEIHMV